MEVDDEAEGQHLGAGARPATEWTWLACDALRDAAAAVELPNAGTGRAYVSGEASRVQAWRGELERLGLDVSATTRKAYWGTGTRQRHAR